ncbi:hypothetical protein BGZ99_005367 [Dissophora globulifera]|uniref:Uncharacterized protein n=1 Tax=Dissophora globulifera TaxID=979702 RepID=A0A9P6UTR5_9FUNG|nr:hypothetical protein BGZ99_005367 [Dissophora globulifera]
MAELKRECVVNFLSVPIAFEKSSELIHRGIAECFQLSMFVAIITVRNIAELSASLSSSFSVYPESFFTAVLVHDGCSAAADAVYADARMRNAGGLAQSCVRNTSNGSIPQ